MSAVSELSASAAWGLRRLGAMPSWLAAGADGVRVAAVLQAGVPELSRGQWKLRGCEPKLRLKAGDRWTAAYQLTLTDSLGEQRSVRLVGEYRPARHAPSLPLVAVGELGAPGWRAEVASLGLTLRTQPHDDDLPALPDLTDPARARRLFEESLQSRWPGIRIDGCAPEVLRYKPGSRCTVRYRVAYGKGPSGPDTIVAKTHRGDKGRNAYAAMAAIGRAGIPAETVALAEPLAYRPDLHVLLQGPVEEEETLKAQARRACATGSRVDAARLREMVAKAADGLAAIHACGIEHGDLVTWDDELAEVRELVARLEGPVPGTADAAAPYLAALADLARDHAADRPGPAHRSFRPAQVLLAGGRIAVVDFDGFCTAEPAIDVAMFHASLRDAGLGATSDPSVVRARLAVLDDVCDHFLARYRAARPISPPRVALWEGLDLLTYVLHCWTKLKPARLVPRMAMLEHHLVRMQPSFGSGS